MDALRILGLSLIVVCFVFFIAIRAIKTHNYIRKAVFLSFVGLGLLMFFFGGLIFDVINSQLDSYVNYYGFAYYIPPLVVIVFTILIFILYFSKGYKYHQKFRMVYKKEKSEITIRDKKQYIYLLLSYKNQMLLKIETTKTGDKNYSNIIVKFPRNEFFYDEYIKKIIKKNAIRNRRLQIIGDCYPPWESG